MIGTAITLLGIPSALSFGVLSDVTILNQSVFDFAGLVTDNILMPLGGLTMCYYVGWKWKPEYLLAEIEADGTKFRLGKLWVFCIRFLTPIMVGIVSVTGFYNLYLRFGRKSGFVDKNRKLPYNLLKFRQGHGNRDRMCLTVDQGRKKTICVII